MGLARTGINVKRSQVFQKHVKGEFGQLTENIVRFYCDN